MSKLDDAAIAWLQAEDEIEEASKELSGMRLDLRDDGDASYQYGVLTPLIERRNAAKRDLIARTRRVIRERIPRTNAEIVAEYKARGIAELRHARESYGNDRWGRSQFPPLMQRALDELYAEEALRRIAGSAA